MESFQATTTNEKDGLRRELAAARQRVLALEEKEKRYRNIFENAAEGIFQISPDGRFLLANPAMARMLGYTSPEDLLQSVTNIRREFYVHDDDYLSLMEKLETADVVKNFEGQFYQAGGSTVWLTFNIHAQKDSAGQLLYYEGTAQDISERKAIEATLRRREIQLTEVQEMVHLGSWEWDVPGNKVNWSDELYRIYGLDKETFGATFEGYLARVHPDDRERVQQVIGQVLATAEPFCFQERIIRPDGEERVLESIGKLVVDQAGQPLRLVGSCLDITDRKAAERQVKETAARAEALVQTAAVLNAQIELDTVLATICQQTALAFNVSAVSVSLYDEKAQRLVHGKSYGLPPEYDQLVHPFEVPASLLEAAETSTKSFVIRRDVRLGRHDPNAALYADMDIQTMISAGLVNERRPVGTLNLHVRHQQRTFTESELILLKGLSDQAALAITNAQLHEAGKEHAAVLEQRVSERTAELEQQNRALVKARERAEAADRLKSVFLAIMSHELRTPLNSIIGFTGLMLQELAGPLNQEQAKQMGMVKESAHHLLSLINDVLDISKIEAGQMTLEKEDVEIPALVNRVAASLRPAADKKRLRLVVELDPAVAVVTSDARRVEQVLINLVGNAIKFTEKGQVHIRCRFNEANCLLFQITDTGIGISADDIDKLFQPFSQIDSGINRRHDGTGLGLSISRRLVEMLGGEIWVESRPGVGSTFSFTLPVERW